MARAPRRQTEAVKRAEQRSTRVMWAGMLVGGAVAVAFFLTPKFRKPPEETITPVQIHTKQTPPDASDVVVEELGIRIVQRYPHDPRAFTQGLLWYDESLYESTGQYGRSSLRKVRLEDGKVLAERKLAPDVFGEGLARVDDNLTQLTWRSGLAIVSNIETLAEKRTMRYQGEGWGLCFDGDSLIMSDGSSTLIFRDPETMEVRRRVKVTRDGIPMRALNELECVGPDVYANVWRRNEIVRIDLESGQVTASIDARGLLSRSESANADVLNGIAYRPEAKTFLLTGKHWPTIFEVELTPR